MKRLFVYAVLFFLPYVIEVNSLNAVSFTKIGKIEDTIYIKDLPPGAMPFQLDYGKRIYLDVIINDSISGSILFDTGADVTRFKDPLYSSLPEYINVKANKYLRKYLKSKLVRWSYSFLGYNFFDKKIIEINYEGKYLLEHLNVDQLCDYDRVKIKRDKKYLLVPVIINVQGKIISGNFILDTGSNAAIAFSKPVLQSYGLDLQKMDSCRVGNTRGWYIAYCTTSDTIRINKSFVTEKEVMFLEKRQFYDNNNHIGLLGCDFLSQFNLVLDLKNDYLYLKKR